MTLHEECEAILNSVSEGVFTVDENWRITSFNAGAERILGIARQQALGRICSTVLRADLCEEACALRYTLATGLPVVNYAARLTAADGRSVPVSISTAVLRERGGRALGAVETFRDLSQVEELRQALKRRYTHHEIVSTSPRMREILDLLPAVAASDSTVLIQGESGTGKELVARAIHEMSARRGRPLITLNCAALPESLVEAELFGYRSGAFTGATHTFPGRLVAADGGTLFLDEIGEMSPALQAKVLRVLEGQPIEPLGGVRPVSVDVRFVAATHHDLALDVAHGTFREDLFYRLNVITLTLPPLRERKEDIPLLVEHFLAHLTTIRGKDIAAVSPEALQALIAHDYPGNVRELQNAIEHAFVLCPGGVIQLHHLPEKLRGQNPPDAADLPRRVAAFEAALIRDALRRTAGNRAAAARELGIHRTTLFKKLRTQTRPSSVGGGRRRPDGA